jgi:hypothetical protein
MSTSSPHTPPSPRSPSTAYQTTWAREVDKLKNRLSVLSQSSMEMEDVDTGKGPVEEGDTRRSISGPSRSGSRSHSPALTNQPRPALTRSSSTYSDKQKSSSVPTPAGAPQTVAQSLDQHPHQEVKSNHQPIESEFVTAKRREQQESSGDARYECELRSTPLCNSLFLFLERPSSVRTRLTDAVEPRLLPLRSLLLRHATTSQNSDPGTGSYGREDGVQGCHPSGKLPAVGPIHHTSLPSLILPKPWSLGIRPTPRPFGRLPGHHQLPRILPNASSDPLSGRVQRPGDVRDRSHPSRRPRSRCFRR